MRFVAITAIVAACALGPTAAAGATTSGHGAPTVTTHVGSTCYHIRGGLRCTPQATIDITFAAGTVAAVDGYTINANMGDNAGVWSYGFPRTSVDIRGLFVPSGGATPASVTVMWHGLDGVSDSESCVYTPSTWSCV